MNNQLLETALAALRAADDDIRELLQVAKYNLHGMFEGGPPAHPVLVHQCGIARSEQVREQIRATILAVRAELEKPAPPVPAAPVPPAEGITFGCLRLEPVPGLDADWDLCFNQCRIGTVNSDVVESVQKYMQEEQEQIRHMQAQLAVAAKLRQSAGHLGYVSSDDTDVIRGAGLVCNQWDALLQPKPPTTI